MGNLSKKGRKTRQKILNGAFELFHGHGVHATSVDDILARSGAGKSQFYHYFESKEEILHVMLQGILLMIREGQTHFKPIHSWEDFRNWLDRSIDKQREWGCSRACPVGQIAAQLSDEDVLLKEDVRSIFEAMKAFPRRFFMTLQEQGALVDNADPDVMADMCIAVIQGSALMTKVNLDENAMVNSVDYLYAHMRSFLR